MNVLYHKRSRFPIQPAKGLCRGCHKPVPKGRRSWCSQDCINRYEPGHVRKACEKRDNGVCSLCGRNVIRLSDRLEASRRLSEPFQHRYFHKGIFDRAAYDLAWQIYKKHLPKRIAASKKRIAAMKEEGWPPYVSRDWWEMDHIIPFSEGGKTVLENVRTLCVLCHKKRTRQWHKDRTKPMT